MAGRVRPEAIATLDSLEMAPDGPDPWETNWWRWFLPADWPSYILDVGDNVLEIRADLDDETSVSTSIAVTCDPALRTVPGYITSLSETGGTYQLGFEAGRIEDQPDGWGIVDPSPVSFDVAADVLFVAFNGQPAGDTRFIFTTAEFAEQTSDCTPTNAVPYELLVDSDDQVQQAMQLEPTLHFCLGE